MTNEDISSERSAVPSSSRVHGTVAFWSFGITAITFNRIGKEDTLMVFFMLFAFYFFISAKQTNGNMKQRFSRLRNLSGVSFGLMMASKYFPHYLGLNMLYHHNYS